MNDIKKVLIAEDSPTQALQLQMILEEHGYEVLVGKNGKEALKLIDSNSLPDIIITDIVMPEMDGYELCSNIKSNDLTRDIPVILLTQLSDPNDVIKGLQAGADNFISKPYSKEFLFERIQDILLNREIRKRSPNLDIVMEIFFGGQKYKLNSNRLQILDLLLSTYHNAINKNKELEDRNIELKKLHKELKIGNIQLKKLNEEKNQLLGIAAHDLRSPLATVYQYFDLITCSLEKDTIPNQEEITTTVNRLLEFMLNLIVDVLDFSKIEAGEINLKKEDFNLIDFLNEQIKLNNILGSQKNIKVIPEYNYDKIMLNADPNKLKQVMDNLLSNTFKYSERNTKVRVNASVKDGKVQIVIADEGKGIPKNELGKLFQPFTTTSVKSTGGEKSTGLGLVSVKKIVETHGGNIWVESGEGVGSQFYFTLPCNGEVVESTKEIRNSGIHKNEDGTKKLKIIVAENEETIDKFLSIILNDIADTILHAQNGNKVVEMCRNNPDVDLIIMDIMMPEIDGLNASRKIREFNKDVIIIANTAYTYNFNKDKALEAGCNDYITKPIKKEILFEKIRNCLDKKNI
ncbi:MAG: response regulator [Salinivirgaceae bacterium]|nr:response regulator [Salinivirgaceae bacterium]